MNEQIFVDCNEFVGGGSTAPRFQRKAGNVEEDVSAISLRSILVQALELDIRVIKVERREPYKSFHGYFIQGDKVLREIIGPCFGELRQHLRTFENKETEIEADKILQEFLDCFIAPQDFIEAVAHQRGKTYRLEVTEAEEGIVEIHLK